MVWTDLLNMSETISTSVNAASIFSAEESWGLPPKRKDILVGRWWEWQWLADVLSVICLG